MSNFDKDAFTYEDLIACAEGKLFGAGNAQLPMPPMLMFNKISKIDTEGGLHSKGQVIAEMSISKESWFFDCHFRGDPVMPGCLGLDALWQLLGFIWAGSVNREKEGRLASGR